MEHSLPVLLRESERLDLALKEEWKRKQVEEEAVERFALKITLEWCRHWDWDRMLPQSSGLMEY
jgi:hypothetical protein